MTHKEDSPMTHCIHRRRFAGAIRIDGRDIARLRPDQRAHAGVGG